MARKPKQATKSGGADTQAVGNDRALAFLVTGSLAVALIFMLVSTGAFSGSSQPSSSAVDDMIGWIEQNSGFVDTRVQEVSTGPDPTSTLRGIYARESISQGDILAKIPKALLFGDEEGPFCSSIQRLSEELQLRERSKFWPYLRVADSATVTAPGVWAPIDLQVLLGLPDLSELGVIYGFQPLEWVLNCGDHLSDLLWVRAAALFHTRSAACSETTMCMMPWFDLYNHCNGPAANMECEIRDQANSCRASRDILVGEQICFSYGAIGAPRLFATFGFLAPPPQRWWLEPSENASYDFVIDNEAGDVSWPSGVEAMDFRAFAKKAGKLIKQMDQVSPPHDNFKKLANINDMIQHYRDAYVRPGDTPVRSLAVKFREAYVHAVRLAFKAAKAQLPRASSKTEL